jgi:superfamily II DNA or RNA helicase
MSEGIDLPHLNTVINAAANKGNVKTVQILGRILRKLEGKTGAKYIDFIDESKFFKFASYARKRILRSEGHDVEVEDVKTENQ